jgi:hypothetical protein
MMIGMPCDVSPGPTMIMVVARMKVSVVVANRKMCPME